ncbi:MAG: NAD-binding protein [Candidatus Marsarchaeota archaeon]|nr:NAD-binding protein [Candidatus Marsarchaeota archaeon]
MATQKLENHVVVCGYGVVGQKVVEALEDHGVQFIIIEYSPSVVDTIKELNYNVILGDATSSKTLRAAGITSAKAIAVVMDNDAKNIFTVLTARDLNKSLFIATRANDERIREKFVEAGADYIVTPQKSASDEIIGELKKKQ